MTFRRAPLALLIAQVCCLPVWAQAQAQSPTQVQTDAARAKTLETVVVRDRADAVSRKVGQKELEKEPPRDIRGVFDNVIGVEFTELGMGAGAGAGTGGQGGEVEIRGVGGTGDEVVGVGSNRVKMEVDGMELGQSMSYGNNVRNGRQYIDPADLKAVEIYKGAVGSGFAGSVQMRTKDPADYLRQGQRVGGEVRAGYSGGTNDRSLGASIATRISEISSVSLSYTRHNFNELKNKGGQEGVGAARTRRDPLHGRSNGLNGKWVIEPAAHNKITVLAQHFDSKSEINRLTQVGTTSQSRVNNGQTYRVDTQTHSHFTTQKMRRDALSLAQELGALRSPAFDALRWQLAVQKMSGTGLSTIHRTVTTTRTAPPNLPPYSVTRTTTFPGNNDLDIKSYSLKTDFYKTLGQMAARGGVQHDVHYGLNLALTDNHLSYVWQVENPQFPRQKQTQWVAHVSDRIQLGSSGLAITPSLNVTRVHSWPKATREWPSVEKQSPFRKTSAGGGLLLEWQPAEEHLLTAQYGRAVRMPGFGELNNSFVRSSLANLRPEKADTVELAWSSRGKLGRQKTALFHNRYRDMIQFDCDDSTGTLDCYVDNLTGKSSMYGAEFEGALDLAALGAPRGLMLEGGLIWNKGKEADGRPMYRINPLGGNLALRFEAPDERWSLAARVKFAAEKKRKDLPDTIFTFGQRAPARWPAKIAGWGVVDLVGYYKPTPQLTISGGIYNVGDKLYARWSRYRNGAARINASPRGMNYYTEAGRTIALNVRYQF